MLEQDNPLYKVATINEATKLWKSEAFMLRRIMQNRSEQWELRKSGKGWLILYDAMIRVYAHQTTLINETKKEI